MYALGYPASVGIWLLYFELDVIPALDNTFKHNFMTHSHEFVPSDIHVTVAIAGYIAGNVLQPYRPKLAC